MSDSGSGSRGDENNIEVLLAAPQEIVSSEDSPMSQWSSLESVLHHENKKKALHAQGVYSPGSGDLCAKYITMSSSSVYRHAYYKYPAVTDPGIKEALLAPEKPVIYPDDGQDLYLALCEDMNQCPVRLFHRNLLSEEINLRYYCVDPFGVRAMAIALQYNPHVRRIDFTDNFLNDDACYHLSRTLHSNVTLQELILAGCRIRASGLACLLANVETTRTLETLDISRNELGEDGGVTFAHKVEAGIPVQIINVSKNQLGQRTALALTEALEFRNRQTHVDLSWNNFYQAPSTAKMLHMLAQSEYLESLNLSWNAMEGEKIAEAIKDILLCPKLADLNLSNNRFHGEDIAIIASGLIKANKLVTLDFSSNPLSTDDAQVLIDKMKRPAVKLQNLLLNNVDVSKQFLESLHRVQKMKSRKNFYTTFGHVSHAWEVTGPDPRKVLLERAAYLGASLRHKVDVPWFLLQLNKDYGKPIAVKEMLDIAAANHVPLGEDLLIEFCNTFPGGRAKVKTINLETTCEYIKRLWPDKQLPPTPVPEEEPEPPSPLPPSPPSPAKGKGKK